MSGLDELRDQVLPLAKLVVTHWGYLRPDARDKSSLSGMFFLEADALLNPIFGSPEKAHRAVLDAIAGKQAVTQDDEAAQATRGQGSR